MRVMRASLSSPIGGIREDAREDRHEWCFQHWQTSTHDTSVSLDGRPNGRIECGVCLIFGSRSKSKRRHAKNRGDAHAEVRSAYMTSQKFYPTHNAPRVNTTMRPYFCLRGINNAMVDGIGKTNMMQSPRMLATAFAYQKAVRSMHVPGFSLRFQARAIGSHCTIVATMLATAYEKTYAMTTYVIRRKVTPGKI